METTEEGEIMLVDKPVGISSFTVIRELRTQLGIRKMGHAGTLDPLASGLMIIGIGKATKRLTEFIKLDKEYIAEILVGEKRSTGDMEGIVIEERAVTETFPREQIEMILEGMIGRLPLPVSAYSAIKKDGVPLYKRARKAEREGKLYESVPVREMAVMETEFLDESYEEGRYIVKVRFFVGSGTYIRSLAEEFGKRLGYPATLRSLRRTKVGEFDIKDARALR